MTGHQKLKPLGIGRSKNPRCFKDAKSLEVDYDLNKKSWMTSKICKKWVQKLEKRLIAECRKIALAFDNCPAHPKEIDQKLKNVTVFYLPRNTTSKLQPMDQRVMKNFKIRYRKRIVRKLSLRWRTINPCQDQLPGKHIRNFQSMELGCHR
ncbi:Tigger transposable element-derived protein 4 [Araneus ventricosus]|uniref:Tigger transposable element-derived protein 4 n=1 Tax=Araneus ventricosus TaxID=182803 RepID=A0A4Y2J0T5_ARAVE|nr:Tigger transposable element-derived protein 4 [Araneus ventricosus]